MKESKQSTFKLLAITVMLIISALLALKFPGTAATYRQQKDKQVQIEKRTMPTAAYPAADTLVSEKTAGDRAFRQARNLKYDKKGSQRFDELAADTVDRAKVIHWWFDLPGLPAGQSDAVILGRVIDAKGFVSNDKTGAYSEFTIFVEDIYKDDFRFSANSSITAEREGALIELPDGRRIRYYIVGQGMPQKDRRIVLFLKHSSDNTYHILTGYELIEGIVFPIDEEIERFSPFKSNTEGVFLKAVLNAVANPPQVSSERRRPTQ